MSTQFNTKSSARFSRTLHLCVPYDSHNSQSLFLQASVNDWFFNGQAVFLVST